MNVDARVARHAIDGFGQKRLQIVAVECLVEPPGRAAKLLVRFYQVHGEALISQCKRGRHACHPTTDHECGVLDRDGLLLERQQLRRPAHGHPDEIHRLRRSLLRIARVHPGALIANVGHLQQIGVETGIAQRIAEDRFVGSRRAGGDDDAIQAILVDPPLDLLLVVVSAGIDAVLGEGHVGEVAGVLDDGIHRDDGGDVAATVADEHADARRLIRDVVFGWIVLAPDPRIPCWRQQCHGAGGCGACLHHGVGDVLGFLEGTADEDARPRSIERAELTRVCEAPLVQFDADLLGLLAKARAGLETEREHHHVELFLDLLDSRARVHETKVVRIRHLVGSGDEGADVTHAEALGPLAIAVEVLPERPEVQEEDGDFEVRLVFLGQDRFLGGGHTADARTIVVAACRIA